MPPYKEEGLLGMEGRRWRQRPVGRSWAIERAWCPGPEKNHFKKLQILWGLFEYLPTKTIQCELLPLSAQGILDLVIFRWKLIVGWTWRRAENGFNFGKGHKWILSINIGDMWVPPQGNGSPICYLPSPHPWTFYLSSLHSLLHSLFAPHCDIFINF